MSFLCQDPAHAEPFACHCQAEGGYNCEFYGGLLQIVERLQAADVELKTEATAAPGWSQHRLLSKAEGVRLALSYVEEALRS